MTESWESTCVVKQVKWKKTQSRDPESVYPNSKWQREAEMREGESDNQGRRGTCGATCSKVLIAQRMWKSCE